MPAKPIKSSLSLLGLMTMSVAIVQMVIASCAFSAATPSAPDAPLTPAPSGIIDLPMDHNPQLPEQKTITTFNPRLKTLWLKALGRPEADIRRQAANAFAKAHAQGMDNLSEAKVKLLSLVTKDKDLSVRVAAAKALVELNYKKAADAMIAGSEKDGYPIAQVVYPALAKWHIKKAQALWKKQIKNKNTRRAVLLLAINAIGSSKDNSAAGALAQIITNQTNAQIVRLAAARAIGSGIGADSVIQAAKKLIDKKTFDALLAATMLNNHQSAKAQNLLLTLADNKKSTVVAAALKSLNNIAPKQIAGSAETWLIAADAQVRKQAIKSLKILDTKTAVRLLGRRLGDTNSNLRNLARTMLAKKSEHSDLNGAVLDVIKTNLQTSNWGALEQATLLAKQIGDKSAAPRLVQLLDYNRPEVRLAAATALRSFHLPNTMPALLKRAQQLTKMAQSATGASAKAKQIGYETTQILQAFGLADYKPADSLLRKYIPKSAPFAINARAAAIWALGKLHENKLDKKLAKQLTRRMLDNNMMNPEAPEVKRFSAIALGRMKAKKHLRQLKKVFNPSGDSQGMADFTVQMASRWAIGQITGKLPPAPKPVQSESTGWFLEPAD